MDDSLQLDEATARRLLLVRAIEDSDLDGQLLQPAEREDVERGVVEHVRRVARGPALDRGGYLRQRAQALLAAVARRNPEIAAMQHDEPWRRWVAWTLPLATVAFGAAVDRFGSPGRIDLLAPGLALLLLWNLTIYLWLGLRFFLPRPWPQRSSFGLFQAWLADRVLQGRPTGRVHIAVTARFYHQWLQHTACQQRLWWHQVLHTAAAGWAVGLVVSMLAGAWLGQERIGWASAWLEPRQVQGLLALVLAPVVTLTPLGGFTLGEVQRLGFDSGAMLSGFETRQWLSIVVGLLALIVIVIVPRAALAGMAAWRRRPLNREVHIDLRDPYYLQVLSRVSPTRVTLGYLATSDASRQALQQLFAQAGTRPAPARWAPGLPWTVLATSRGDALRVFEWPADGMPSAPTVAATVGAGAEGAAGAWLQRLLRAGTASARPAAMCEPWTQAVDEADLVVLLPAQPDDLPHQGRLLRWLDRPALVLAPAGSDLRAFRAEVQRAGLRADVLDLAACSANWSCDAMLLDALRGRLPMRQRAGLARLAQAWTQQHHDRFSRSMSTVAAWLVQAARAREPIAAASLLDRWLGRVNGRPRTREAALAALQLRLSVAEASMVAVLDRLQGSGAPRPAGKLRLDGQDRASGQACAEGVGLDDAMLRALTASALLHYLRLIHQGRRPLAAVPAAWQHIVTACVQGQRKALDSLWRDARAAGSPAELVPPLAQRLEALASQVLARV